MSEKHSIASKARWAGISAEERTRRMSAIAKRRMMMMSKEERLKLGRALNKKRWAGRGRD